MKKVLLTSTALVAFSGAAVADVALSGRAEMGIFGNNGVDGNAQFFTDIDVTFTMSGETDNGLTFGASVDLDEGGSGAAAVADNSDDGGATIFISGAFGTVTMGDTDGALDWALTDGGNIGNPGSLADDETSFAGYVGSYLDGGIITGNAAPDARRGDGQILRWDYTSGAFGVAISLEDDNGSDDASSDIGYAIGLRYALDITGGTINFGIGHQEASNNTVAADAALAAGFNADQSVTGISIAASLDNGLSAGIQYADWDVGTAAAAPDSNLAVGLGYTSGAFSIHANYGLIETNGGVDTDGYGLAAAYDLGGGAVVHFGYGKGGTDGAPDTSTYSLGLGLSF